MGLACSGIAAVISLGVGFIIKLVIGAINHGQYDRLAVLSLSVLGLFAVKYWFTRGQSLFLSMAATRLTTDLRKSLFEKLQRLPISFYNERKVGGLQSVLTNDVNVFQSAVGAVRDAIDGPIKAVGGTVFLFVLQWKLALAALAVLPFLAAYVQRNSRKLKAIQREVQDDLAAMTSGMQESLTGVRVVKAFSAERAVADRFAHLAEKTYSSQVKSARRIASLKPTVELVGAVALSLVVYLCGRLIQSGEFSIEGLTAFVYTLDQINQGAKNLGNLKQTTSQVQAALDRIDAEILTVPDPESATKQALPMISATGRFDFNDVSFTYPDGTQALHKVSFTIMPGESIALVGPSGSGKSTLVDLLLRFYEPTSGEILLDGVNIKSLPLEEYRKLIGIVPQQTFLFAGTIEDNIRMGRPEASEAEVQEAVSSAHAQEFIQQMPEGLQTSLGERGVRLSGGQAQRIAIARALVRKPTLLVMDEATSNLDAISEAQISAALTEVMPNQTTLFIVHRLSSAARAHRVIMLNLGVLIEQGTFTELLANGGPFSRMYSAFSEATNAQI